MGSILVVDDDAAIRTVVGQALRRAGHLVRCVGTLAEARAAIAADAPELLISDVVLPDGNGLDAVADILASRPALPVIILSAQNTLTTAVRATEVGAYDYLPKPFDLDALARAVTSALARGQGQPDATLDEADAALPLIGRSMAMQDVYRVIARVVANDLTVLISGESGTGKELVAAAIHRLSDRAKGPFLPVNCSAIPGELLESEFFGHVRGAFSGAVSDTLGLFRGAHQGTIFLDEIAELPPALQVKLLRVLQEMQVRPVGSTKAYPVDVRVIAATNRNLDQALATGAFRQDLFYRLNVVRISLPPLRDRLDDIPALGNHFLRRFNRRFRREVRGITPEAVVALQGYDFPGNVRELENLMERAYAMGAKDQITVADLALIDRPLLAVPTSASSMTKSIPTLAEVEKELILKALTVHKNDKEAAAHALGLSRRTIYRRLKEYGLL